MDRVNRILYIDGLRAVAVLAVVAHHSVKYAPVHLTGALAFFALQGHHGVELFFVISGFCLSYPTLLKLQEGPAATFDLVRYGAKRIVRILPPYYIAILLFALIGTQQVSAADIARQALFMDGGTQFLNGSFWSLAVEFRWYLFFPLTLLLWVRSPRTFIVLVFGLFILQHTRAVSTDFTALPEFMLGIVAAHLAIHPHRKAWLAFPLFVATTAGALSLTPASDSGQDTSALWEISAFLLVVAGGAMPAVTRSLSAAPLAFIGIASYGIYLCHELGIQYAERWGYGPWLAGAVGLLVGIAFWALCERPFTQSPLRSRLVAAFETVLPRCFGFCAISPVMRLERVVRARPEVSTASVPHAIVTQATSIA